MKVAILFSGGKDSTYVIEYAMQKKYDIEYLLSIKPGRKDCYLFHYATVEHAPKIAKILGLKNIFAECNVANPKEEAKIIKKIIKKNPVDALFLGGVGLQKTQIKNLRKSLATLGVKVLVPHEGKDHIEIMKEMTEKGYKFMITQIASDGLDEKWLGKIIGKENLNELLERARKYGFHEGFEGGYADTFVVDAPIFNKKIEILKSRKIMESENTGHLVIENLKFVNKNKTN